MQAPWFSRCWGRDRAGRRHVWNQSNTRITSNIEFTENKQPDYCCTVWFACIVASSCFELSTLQISMVTFCPTFEFVECYGQFRILKLCAIDSRDNIALLDANLFGSATSNDVNHVRSLRNFVGNAACSEIVWYRTPSTGRSNWPVVEVILARLWQHWSARRNRYSAPIVKPPLTRLLYLGR